MMVLPCVQECSSLVRSCGLRLTAQPPWPGFSGRQVLWPWERAQAMFRLAALLPWGTSPGRAVKQLARTRTWERLIV